MVDGRPRTNRTDLFFPLMALATGGIAVIVLAGSLGAATSGRSALPHGFAGPGQTVDGPGRTTDLPEIVVRSGV